MSGIIIMKNLYFLEKVIEHALSYIFNGKYFKIILNNKKLSYLLILNSAARPESRNPYKAIPLNM